MNVDLNSAEAIAEQLINALPAEIGSPEIAAETDGSVNLEWYVHPRRVLNLSIASNGRIHWAALIGDEDPRGTVQFDGDAPKTIVYFANLIMNDHEIVTDH